jgi:predicted membrane channel-forming protein YqfA (hemolysin III family)
LLVTLPDFLDIPLHAGPGMRHHVWALVNLILAIAGALLAIITGIRVLVRDNKEKDYFDVEPGYSKKQPNKHRLEWILLSILAGIAGIIVFILTEDMRLPMVLVDEWTIVNAIIFIAGVISYIFAIKRDKDNGSEVLEEQNNKNHL